MRHGNTFEEGQTPIQIGRRTDLPLTAVGREQAMRMAQHLQKSPPIAIFSGTLKRQMESALIIAQNFNLPVQQTEALTEIDYGPWEGLSAEAIAQSWPEEYAAWSQRAEWPSLIFKESFDSRRRRWQTWIQSLYSHFPHQTVLAVTSQGPLRLLYPAKVQTGHYCELQLRNNGMDVCDWNLAT